ncbi:MAG: GAF domain-containing protein, partial [Methylomonas sp.]
LERELEQARLLHEVSTELIQADNVEALYEKMLDTAMVVSHSDFASLQMLDAEGSEAGGLRLLGYRGFNPQAAKFWEWVTPASASACSMVLRTKQRVCVPDVRQCEFMAGSTDLACYLETGILAVLTTPLVSRSGELLGMLSTHWRDTHEPTDGEQRALDVLARQAADLLAQKRAEAVLQTAES